MKRFLVISLAVVLALGLAIVAFQAQPAMAQATIYVDDDAPNDPGPNDATVSDPLEDGSATHPFDEIQEGIDDALSGDTVQVASGTYYENIILQDGVQVLGAGNDVTTIEGGGAGSIVTATGVGSETVLDGFTVRNGGFTWWGGGMNNYGSSPRVTNCTFSNNSCMYGGGGMANRNNSAPTVINCTFSNNSAREGGGMHSEYGSSPTVTNCTFSNNSAGDGGGMHNFESSPSVTYCTFYNNSADSGSGMYNYNNGSPAVTNCLFVSNSSAWRGGGMFTDRGSPTVTNCTFSNNSSMYGGGMCNVDSSPSVTNCILWGNGEEINDARSTPVVTYCDVQGVYPGEGNISADPMFVDPTGGDYHLQAGSPCIDAGTNTDAPSEDIEGNPRPIDGDGDSFADTDMGAYEYVPPAPPLYIGGTIAAEDRLEIVMPWIIIALIAAGIWTGIRNRRSAIQIHSHRLR